MFGPTLDIVLLLYVLILILYLYLTWNFNYWQKRGLRTAQSNPIIGTYPSIVTRKRNLVFDIHDVYLKYKHNNRAVGVYVTRKPAILILDPKLAQEILISNFRDYHTTITSSWINNPKQDKYAVRNPFWCDGEDWKTRRTDAAAGLTQNKLKQSYAIWQATSKKLKNFMLEKTINGSAIIETKDLMSRFTADVISDFIWGIDAGNLTTSARMEPSSIVTNAEKWMNHSAQAHVYSYLSTLAPVVRRLIPYRFFPKDTDAFFSTVTRDAVEMRTKQSNPERPDFLNHMLQLRDRKGLSHDDLVGHSLTVFLDGYESTAYTLFHTLFYLAKHSNVQNKLRDEILTHMQKDDDGRITLESLMSLSYLDQCVHETLRIITLIPNFSRICTKATKLVLSNEQSIDIPVGMVLTVPTYSFHHDEDFFPEPQSYMPERFDNAAHLELTKQGKFLPFGDGPRICLGTRVALMTVKSALVEIISQYQVNSCAQTQLKQNTNVKSFILGIEGDIILEYKKL